jgi:GR25 family glycosyltransferase involved in LPS biosynthesis
MQQGMCSRGPKAKMLGLDYMNTDGLLYWQLHEQNVFSPGEYGCTFSHLRAIHQAFIDGEQTALIVEDDIRFEDMPLWPETLQDVVAAAPPDWDILQLWTNNPSFYEYFQRGRDEGIPPMAKEGVDTTGPVCQEEGGLGGSGTHYNRPAFVPWYDDVYVEWSAGRKVGDAPVYGGLWSTMAYLINRKGMAKVINKFAVGPDRLGNLTLPVLADHILFSVAKTYTYTRPLFRAYPRESTIQPTMEAEIDPTKGRVDPQADPHTLTDGLTNKFIETYWKEGTCPLTTPELKPLNLAVIATASFTKTERRIQAANIGRLAKGVDGVRCVTYAINAIDNNVAGWTSSGWTQMSERLGIPAMVVSAGRDKERGFESKLVSQLPLIGHIKRRAAFDYLFTIDGDISFAKVAAPEPSNPNPNPDPKPDPDPDPLIPIPLSP